ncbi:D-alanyl-D-alanine carboxypeptidase family protein [Clostridium sp.]|uniref:D-alanyl-D-alanine carboxypeptidase family protein n=1 Tax=Clostridium sp. TaxID=1506 RepID=UPI0026DBB17E|nr:D-alanyl-D-alanine carboxypeptidase family protein [Clostridium sp.]MDO5039574.1 D-alanyl-D-alanine carboxypeptidase family protein [Clostridium sp.]
MKNTFKIICRFLFLALISLNVFTINAFAEEKPPNLNAESALLMDAKTGQVLYSKEANKKQFPASTTKVLTALVVLDNAKLTDVVTVGKNPPFADGSSIGLKEGEKFTVETLLTGLLLESGNDCAEALAEYVGGTTSNFVKMMNEKAKALGCNDSNFENPSGLPNDKHVSTAYDLALILKEAIKNPDYINISRKISVELPPSNLDKEKRWANNHNHLINKNSKYYYKYALVGKSGYTDVARHTFVISAQKDNRTLIATFLKAEDKNKNFEDMASLLDYGFNNFTEISLYKKNQNIENIKLNNNMNLPIYIDRDILISAPNSEINKVNTTLQYELPKNIKRKPLKLGETITTADILVDGHLLTKVNLLSGIDREYNFKIAITELFNRNKIIIIPLSITLTILVLLILRIIYVKKKRKKLAFEKKWKHIRNRKR